MPLYKFTVESFNRVTHYVEADSSDDIKEWILNDNNPKDLESGPHHDGTVTTKLLNLEELSPTAIDVTT